MVASADKLLSTAEVATRAGIHRDTLLRWLRQRLVAEPSRDRNGWRVFNSKEVAGVVAFAKSAQPAAHQRATVREEPTSSQVVARLEQIDWDFREAKTSYLTHGLHPYPAKFIPQIPNALIQEFSSVGDTVGDIFCGSGTTLVEGLLLKRNVVGIDANPLACLIAAAKTSRFEQGDKELLAALAARAYQLAAEISPDDNLRLFGGLKFASSAPRPAHKAIEFWFEPFVVEELAEILSWCRALPTNSTRNVALTSLSAIIVNVSKQDSDTRYVRRKKKVKPGDTLYRFAQVLGENSAAVERFSEILEPNLTCRIINADILARPSVPQMSLIVCSPPYPNAYSYHLYHMTRMLWLGMDQPSFKKVEIGSHRKFSSKSRNGATIQTFRTEMKSVFDLIRTVLPTGGHACFVIGNSVIRGKTHENAEVLGEVAADSGFTHVAQLDRTLKDTAKAFNPRIGKIKTERVVVFANRRSSYV
jgi:site-specific DNA-methyltransferase (cytosine-N4-specific)